jgi:hypothetical protein
LSVGHGADAKRASGRIGRRSPIIGPGR